MIDKALILVMFFYAAGFSLVGVQYTLADVYNITLVSPVSGAPIESALVGYLQEQKFNETTENIKTANFTTNSTFFDRVETFTTGAAFVAWEIIGLMTGTYIFYMMNLMLGEGFDIWTTAIIALYVMLLARAILGYVRGI
jgi:hypothetical protein|uniref:ORF31 n=1 Tax=Nitrosopumilaceae spindle-shaped virus TaxID=3065433 RepID=A0AAT9J998_9VIRU